MSLPARDDISPQHRFDLTSIFQTPTEWEVAYETLQSDLRELQSYAEKPLRTTTDLKTLLEATEECYRRKQRLELYATLVRNVDTDGEAANDRLTRYRQVASAFDTAVAAIRRRLRQIDDAHFEALVVDLEEDQYRRYAENLREQASYARSDEIERAVEAFESPRTAPTRIIRSILTGDFDPPTVERLDEECVSVRPGNVRTELSRDDREYRKRVYEAYHEELDRFEHTLARAYVEKLRSAASVVEVRGYDSIRDRDFRQRCYPESGLKSALSSEVHEAMLDGVRDNLEPYHRVQELRKRRLGVETLCPWDLQVSVAECETPTVEYDELQSHVLAALEPLGPDYVEQVRAFFDDRRIDVFPTENKRTDIPAYCPSSASDGAYILANFQEDVRTAFFVCHELGHAMHVDHHRDGPVRYATCPRPVEEVPSLLHELLLADRFIDAGGALAAAARNRLLECLGGNLYGATMSSVFVHHLSTKVESGEDVAANRARETWADLQSEFRPVVEYGDRSGRDWLGRGTRELYSNYQYVLGATGALVVHRKLTEGEFDTTEYREFLRSTGRYSAVESFVRLGCDVTSKPTFERAVSAFDDYVDAMR
ncbi:M3 family oligoendopeptidase [Haloprofundus salilacus]|uniref:M3 family oligoendopeptidase n=1 Tax=Haloprofundus salilacus TaxID=2876190 RepID=UPI001CCDB982|nr:M3 family metallopeptidase [Haloprofundus salilacus]